MPTNANDERGLLGMAFHPGFNNPASPGFRTLYTYNSELIPVGGTPTYIAPNNAPQNYKNADQRMEDERARTRTSSIRPRDDEIISFGKNAGNHNGGTIEYGPDGYLYLALGDGGNANDVGPSHIEPGGNAQNLTTPLGKMLRIDPMNPTLTPASTDAVSANGQYRIPRRNPFTAPARCRRSTRSGFRNPYRFAFDRANGELILADVGQNTIEEIDRITIGGNYGWADQGRRRSCSTARPAPIGAGPGTAAREVPAGLIDPIAGHRMGTLQYDHGDGISITGGFVYRGTAIPELVGKYVFGDLAIRNLPPRVDGRLFYADLQTGLIKEFLLPQFVNGVLPNGLTVHGFGEDGERRALRHGDQHAIQRHGRHHLPPGSICARAGWSRPADRRRSRCDATAKVAFHARDNSRNP